METDQDSYLFQSGAYWAVNACIQIIKGHDVPTNNEHIKLFKAHWDKLQSHKVSTPQKLHNGNDGC